MTSPTAVVNGSHAAQENHHRDVDAFPQISPITRWKFTPSTVRARRFQVGNWSAQRIDHDGLRGEGADRSGLFGSGVGDETRAEGGNRGSLSNGQDEFHVDPCETRSEPRLQPRDCIGSVRFASFFLTRCRRALYSPAWGTPLPPQNRPSASASRRR